MHVGVFDLELVIWAHSVHFSENWAVTQKRLIVERNGLKTGPWYVHVGIFDLEPVQVVWGHSVHFSENWAVSQKQLIVERNGRKLRSFSVLLEKGVRI